MHSTTSFSRRRRDDVAKTSFFSRIVHHFLTLRRSEPYSGGTGLKKSTVKPFLARGLNETPIFRSLLPDYYKQSKSSTSVSNK